MNTVLKMGYLFLKTHLYPDFVDQWHLTFRHMSLLHVELDFHPMLHLILPLLQQLLRDLSLQNLHTPEEIDLLEINISCPNVKEGGIAFGQNPKMVEQITTELKKRAAQPIIMKLSPNVTDITEIAKAAQAGGADALSLINTLTGMKIDINRRAFVLANQTGGLSGPAVKPIAVRMVYQTAHAVTIPIIGMGGICNGEDALEFLMAGATAVAVGK